MDKLERDLAARKEIKRLIKSVRGNNKSFFISQNKIKTLTSIINRRHDNADGMQISILDMRRFKHIERRLAVIQELIRKLCAIKSSNRQDAVRLIAILSEFEQNNTSWLISDLLKPHITYV